MSGIQHLDSVVHLDDLHPLDRSVSTTRSNVAMRLLLPADISQCGQIDHSSLVAFSYLKLAFSYYKCSFS
jgi:hypothetical protein